MQIVYRQDGSKAEVDKDTAAKWVRLGLATLTPPAQHKAVATPISTKGEAK